MVDILYNEKYKMKIVSIANQTTPLCIFPDGSHLCYHLGKVIIIHQGKELKRFSIPVSGKECMLGGSRCLSRLLRFGARAAEALDNTHAVVSIGNWLHELDIESCAITEGWYCGDGIRPLIMTTVKDIRGIADGVYFGGYLGNRGKKPVNIYHRTGIDQWEVVYVFPQGVINHVHNIVADPYRQCLWIFTGDFEEASAIWKVTDNFQKVERVVSNEQKYRGCVAYALPEGLLYATDAPFADNYIYLLNPETFETNPLFPLHGSCIYGCQWKDNYVFSSTVEGDGRSMSRWEFYFGRKRGAGIKDDYVHMYMGNLNDGFHKIYKEKKDCMPYYTFQFGVFKFPYGVNNTDTLYFQPVATKKNDLRLMAIKDTDIIQELKQ